MISSLDFLDFLSCWLLVMDFFLYGIIVIAVLLILIGSQWLPVLQRMRVWI